MKINGNITMNGNIEHMGGVVEGLLLGGGVTQDTPTIEIEPALLSAISTLYINTINKDVPKDELNIALGRIEEFLNTQN